MKSKHLSQLRGLADDRCTEKPAAPHGTRAVSQGAQGLMHEFRDGIMSILAIARVVLSRWCGAAPPGGSTGNLRRATAATFEAFPERPGSNAGAVEEDLDSVIERAKPMLQQVLGNAVQLRLELDAPELHVALSAAEVQRLLWNLAAGAREAMPKGGELSIRTHLPPRDALGAALQPGVVPCDCVVLHAAGTSPARSVQRDTGALEQDLALGSASTCVLGLSSVHAVVEGAGGRVSLHRASRHAVDVEIRMPCKSWGPFGACSAPLRKSYGNEDFRRPTRNGERRGGAEGAPREERATPTVLVVEDDDACRDAYEELLGLEGFRVLTASSVAGALVLCRKHASEIAVVLSDFHLHDANATRLVRALRQARNGVPVLLVSGLLLDDPLFREALTETATESLTKPVEFGRLTATLRRLAQCGPSCSRA